MARKARQVEVGKPHHITLRTLKGLVMFDSDVERTAFLDHVRLVGREEGVTLLSWCLMINHYHLVGVPNSQTALARMMKRVNHRLSRVINSRSDRTGPAFDGRYYSCPMDEPHAIAALRYVNRNPVRSRLALRAADYPWSSARYLLGLEFSDPLVKTRKPFGMALDWSDELQSDPDQTEAIRSSTRRGRPLTTSPTYRPPPGSAAGGTR